MKFIYINECLYYYIQRKNSLIHQYNTNQEDTIKAVKRRLGILQTLEMEIDYELTISHVEDE